MSVKKLHTFHQPAWSVSITRSLSYFLDHLEPQSGFVRSIKKYDPEDVMGLAGGWKIYMSDLRVMFLMTSCRCYLLAGYLEA